MEVTYVSTQQDFVDAQQTHAWRRYTPRGAKLQKLAAALVGIGCIAVALCGAQDHWNVVVEAIIFCWGTYLILAHRLLAPFFFRRSYRRQLTGDIHQSTLTFNDESINCECPGHSHGVLEWVIMKGWLESPTTIMFYLAPARFLYIPKRVLSVEQIQELKALLQSKGIPNRAPKPAKV